MAKVLGLGGIFFKAEDGDAVRAWYRDVLGFPIEDWGGAQFPHPDRGQVVWSPFKADTVYFEPSTQPFMINLIVDRKHERQSQEQRQPEQEDHRRQQPRDRQSFLHGRIRIGNGRNAGHRRQTLGHNGCKRQPDLSQTRICFTRTRLNRDWSIR